MRSIFHKSDEDELTQITPGDLDIFSSKAYQKQESNSRKNH